MAEPNRLSALDGRLDPGAELPGLNSSVLDFDEIHYAAMAQINGAGEGSALADSLGVDLDNPAGRAAGDDDCRLMWNGPGMWLAVSRSIDQPALMEKLVAALAGSDASVTDIGHARTVIGIRGSATRDLLNTGCPLDFDRVKTDQVFSTRFGHLNVLIRFIEADNVEVFVFRSFGEALWEEFKLCAPEFYGDPD